KRAKLPTILSTMPQFIKKTQKTPKREIRIAQKRLIDLMERLKNEENESVRHKLV
ncbi:type II toxin-antitoxin system RelE/ParE family toxin, partial [Aggregatibacter actinomycetemcomitans]|nr:type II toxin-antitoxin system RelE/ParE family toxin [Aggregatibacter actinomycetemcomitans]